MEQAVTKNNANRGLRERVETRRRRAEKAAAARAALQQGVATLREPPAPRVLPPRFATRPAGKNAILRFLEFAGHSPAGERRRPAASRPERPARGEVAYLRGTPSNAAPPPVGLPAYVPPSRDPYHAAGGPPTFTLPGAERRRGRKREPVPMPFFVPLAVEFLVAVAVVAALGFFILTVTRGALDFAGFHIGGERAGEGEITAVEVEAPPPVAAAPVPGEPVTILLMGSDRRAGDNGFRTDVMLLLTIDARNNRVSALSFPRDLVGKIPNYGDGRINIVMGQGGFEAVQGTFADSYGVRPQYYFLINFEGFTGLINSIGGIEIEAAERLEDSCDLYWSRAGICTVEPGKFTMDGDTALWYVRSRKSSSDFDRLRRAQEVMLGAFSRFMDMRAVSRIPELYAQYSADVETNMGIPQILSLLPTAARVAQDRSIIQRFTIPEAVTANWIMPDGAAVLLPNYDAVREIVKEATFQQEE